jgi:hypothetical protein
MKNLNEIQDFIIAKTLDFANEGISSYAADFAGIDRKLRVRLGFIGRDVMVGQDAGPEILSRYETHPVYSSLRTEVRLWLESVTVYDGEPSDSSMRNQKVIADQRARGFLRSMSDLDQSEQQTETQITISPGFKTTWDERDKTTTSEVVWNVVEIYAADLRKLYELGVSLMVDNRNGAVRKCQRQGCDNFFYAVAGQQTKRKYCLTEFCQKERNRLAVMKSKGKAAGH